MSARPALAVILAALATTLATGCGGDPALGGAQVERARADLARVAAHCEGARDPAAARASVDDLIELAREDPTAELDETPLREVLADLVRDLADGCDDELASHLDGERQTLE